jgi:poly-gamma-glutamate synthase PgsB/CapB
MTTLTVLACLAYLAWLVLENHLARKHRSAIRHVIHVNGIRGKSSVSRLIDAGLRAGGFRVLSKTTGTCPALIHADGTETPLARRGRPSVKEQLRILRLAARQHAEVLVIECMAVLPEYQKISEERMLRSDIGVITNVRPDHLDEMGETLDAIAESLSNTIPTGGKLFTADAAYAEFFAERAQSKGTSLVLSGSGDIEGQTVDFAENVALALAVCQHLGITRETALKGIAQYRPDPGAFRVERSVGKFGKRLVFLNAMAANDPASAEKILDQAEAQGLMASGRRMLLVNNRYDRPARLRQFVDFAVKHQGRFDYIVAAGAGRLLMRRALVKRGIALERITRLGSYAELSALEHDAVVFAVGNIVGSGQVRFAADRHMGISNV